MYVHVRGVAFAGLSVCHYRGFVCYLLMRSVVFCECVWCRAGIARFGWVVDSVLWCEDRRCCAVAVCRVQLSFDMGLFMWL